MLCVAHSWASPVWGYGPGSQVSAVSAGTDLYTWDLQAQDPWEQLTDWLTVRPDLLVSTQQGLTCPERPGWLQRRFRSCASPCGGTWCSAQLVAGSKYPPNFASLWHRWTCLMGSLAGKKHKLTLYILESFTLVVQVLREAYPWVIDAGDALLRPVQHQEGSQIGSIGCYYNHSKASPHHSQDSRWKTTWGTWTTRVM